MGFLINMINNIWPSIPTTTQADIDLNAQQADSLVSFQLTQPSYTPLYPASYFHAIITTSPKISSQIHKSLLSAKIISTPEQILHGAKSVNTENIGKNFTNQVVCISIHAQRKLVSMLFFWEEECMRWRAFDGEERRLDEMEALGEMDGADLRVAREGIRIRRGLLPSLRPEVTENVTRVGVRDDLPGYS